MGPPSYMWSVVDRNVVMRCILVHTHTHTSIKSSVTYQDVTGAPF